MEILIRLLINTFTLIITAYILPGVGVDTFCQALLAAFIFGLVNIFIKPLLVILTLPITILTLGLFLFVINALLVLLVDRIVPGFQVNGFLWALGFSLLYSILKYIFDKLFNV